MKAREPLKSSMGSQVRSRLRKTHSAKPRIFDREGGTRRIEKDKPAETPDTVDILADVDTYMLDSAA